MKTPTRIYRQYDCTEKLLKQLLLGAIDDIFVGSLRNRHIRYTNITTLQLLTHLYIVYNKINTSNLESNTTMMKQPYDVDLPIDTIFDQIEDAVEYTSVGNAPFTPVHVIKTTYKVTFMSDMFTNKCKFWTRNPCA